MAEKPENPRKFKWVQEVAQDGSIKYRPNYEVYTFKPPPSEIIEARVRSSLDSATATSSSYAASASFATSASYAFNATSASYAISASFEIIKEVSSSYADTASFAQSGDGIFSGSFSGSYEGDGSQLTGIEPFPFVGDAVITGSLIVSGSNLTSGFRTDTRNVILGYGAGNNQDPTNGPFNVMIGYESGYTNTIGDSNVCIGQYAGYALSTNASDENIFIGKLAGAGGTSPVARMSDANWNIGLGNESLLFLTSGDYNIGFGYRTMRNISTGQQNIGLGRNAIYNVTSGDNNIGIGYNAGFNQTTGDGNITIGSGSLGIAGESNQLRIGNGNTITTISASLTTGDIIFASTASAEYLSTPAGNLSSISASYALTASHALNAVSASYVLADNIDQPFTNVTATNNITAGASISASSGLYGRDLFLGPTARFNHTTGGQFLFLNDINASSVEITGSNILATDIKTTSASGSFSGSFQGDGTNLTNTPSIYTVNGTIGTTRTATITDSFTTSGGQEIRTVNSRIYREVTQASELPTTLVAGTTYIIRGEITLTNNITCNVDGVEIIGIDRNIDHIIWSGTGACFTLTDCDFGFNNVRFSSTVSGNSIISATNVTAGAFNVGRLKVLTIFNCQFRGTYDVMDINGFDLVDINNTLFFYIRATNFGLRFRDVSKLEISSCEIIRWFDESTIPSPSGW